MSEALATQQGGAALEQVVIGGDLKVLSPTDRVRYYKSVCESVGLNPLTRPLEYLTLNGKLTLYARRDATDQLRKLNGVSVVITGREKLENVYIVTAKATDKTGRTDESIGAVSVANLSGENLANAMMKSETKAKRRVTLSICGLGLLDETEVDSVPGAVIGEPAKPPAVPKNPPRVDLTTGEVLDEPPITDPDPVEADVLDVIAKFDAETDIKKGASLFHTVTKGEFWGLLTTSQQGRITAAKNAMKARLGAA